MTSLPFYEDIIIFGKFQVPYFKSACRALFKSQFPKDQVPQD